MNAIKLVIAGVLLFVPMFSMIAWLLFGYNPANERDVYFAEGATVGVFAASAAFIGNDMADKTIKKMYPRKNREDDSQ